MAPTPLEEPTITGSDTKELPVAPGDLSELHEVFPGTVVMHALIGRSYFVLQQRMCLGGVSLSIHSQKLV